MKNKDGKFDRLISIEMFEHMRNWEELLKKLSSDWMREDSKIFLHVFSNVNHAYDYKTDSWMGKYFFTGGIMPSHSLL